MPELIGLAVPLALLNKLPEPLSRLRDTVEHTYVTSSAGQAWACNGGTSGGRELCRGEADLDLAACLARPDGLAGIEYGIDGVCHQIANRILWPAGVKVSGAKGYTFSLRHFDHYGCSGLIWPELRSCLGLHESRGSRSLNTGGLHEEAAEFQGFGTSAAAMVDQGALQETSMAEMNEPPGDYWMDGRLKAFESAIDERLGLSFDQAKREKLLRIQVECLGPQDALVSALKRGELSKEQYFTAFTALDKDCLTRFEDVLGPEDFVRLFDVPLEGAPPAIDPEKFASTHGLVKPPKIPD